MELSNCNLHLVYPEVGPSNADLWDRFHQQGSDRSPSSLTFCRKLCLLGARKHSKKLSESDKFQKGLIDKVLCYLNVDIFLSGCFEKFHAKLVGKLLSSLERYYTLVFHITLVTDQYHLCIIPWICFYLSHPAQNNNKLFVLRRCTWIKAKGIKLFTSPEPSWSFLRLWCRT